MADMAQYMLPAISAMSLAPAFKPHEFDDAVSWRIKQDRAIHESDVQSLAMDELHRVAFRHGLGHSLFCPANLISSQSASAMTQFAQAHYTPGNAVIVGTGVEHEDFVKAVQYE